MAGCGDEVVTLAANLQGHEKAITGIALPERSGELYTSSKDGTVRVWDCNTGRCKWVVDLGCPVGALISNGPWIFCGADNVVKAWNIETNAEFSLDGPAVGQVCALVFDKEMLFAGTDKGVILVWKAKDGQFELVASLTGHTATVVCFIIGSKFTKLYSGSEDHTIKVWDLNSLECVATLSGHSDVVTSLICWDQFLISSSLDCTIKVWHMTETDNFNLEVIYTHNVEHGIIALSGMHDAEDNPVLICCSSDSSIRLYDQPSFDQRAVLFGKQEVRAIQIGVGGLFFIGDASGLLSVWKWLEPAVKVRGDNRTALRKRGREGVEGCGWQPNKHICSRLMLT
ncbi:PREDICTED: zinc finger CCCH domain-containing protein 48-like [Fragaria vesca subsp. vesca]|uniref:zinc finger CCCH domain-containing protein 48-like n=1 Tax=Fragaria vesca subsp. vesca TaxID=101020 RepID=UPI0002C320C6|nr:PREDICTED: zinc finger CCCH domain-containing protein 48-like [Fragaria vesca subsp. vesca]